MSTVSELFAPRFMNEDLPREDVFAEMAQELGADTLRYLPIDAISRALNRPVEELCRACLTGRYPTSHGQKLYQVALANSQAGLATDATGCQPVRTYEEPAART